MYFVDYSWALLITIFAGAGAVPTSAATSDTIIPGYGIEDFIWEVEHFPGGPKKNITGTVQDVVSHLETVNPNWKADFNFKNALPAEIEPAIPKRWAPNYPWTGLLCDVNVDSWGHAFVDEIQQGFWYLSNVPGIPISGPGPSNCGRVSCSWQSAIWWCNDVCRRKPDS